MARVDVTTNFPVPVEHGKRMNDAARRVMQVYGKKYVADWKSRWVGWEYRGRAAKWPRNVSRKAWRAKVIRVETGVALVIQNDARDFRTGKKPYAALVHRAGNDRPEWEVIREKQQSLDDELVRVLTDAIVSAPFENTSRRKVGPSSGGSTTSGGGVTL